jgi:DNA-binding cell septation regulator SpoVG
MDEIKDELQDSLNPDEDGELNTTDTEPTGEEGSDVPQTEEELAEENKKLKASNAKLYARAKKAEEALKGRKDSQNEVKPEPPTDAEWKQKMEFVIKHKDLDEDQIDFISAFAKGRNVSLEEAYKDKLVLKTIEEDAREKKIANAIPSGKSQSPEYKELQQQINEATDRETHKKLWKQFQEQGNQKGVQTE